MIGKIWYMCEMSHPLYKEREGGVMNFWKVIYIYFLLSYIIY